MKVQHAAVSPTCTKYTTHARTHMCHTPHYSRAALVVANPIDAGANRVYNAYLHNHYYSSSYG